MKEQPTFIGFIEHELCGETMMAAMRLTCDAGESELHDAATRFSQAGGQLVCALFNFGKQRKEFEALLAQQRALIGGGR